MNDQLASVLAHCIELSVRNYLNQWVNLLTDMAGQQAMAYFKLWSGYYGHL